MAAPWRNGYCLFLLAANLISNPIVKVSPKRSHSYQTQNTLLGIRKYPQTHPRFYSPFGRNKPRHALSLQTRVVGARKGCFCLFSLCSEGGDEKNR